MVADLAPVLGASSLHLERTDTMATAATRAPRGTKTLSQAFFTAAAALNEDKRPAAIKAALTSIRLEMKAKELKARAAKAKARAAAGKPPLGRPARAA
jgi:hypothetical protein